MNRVLLLCVLLVLTTVTKAQVNGKTNGKTADPQARLEACDDLSAMSAAQQIVRAWRTDYNAGNAAAVAALYSQDAYYLTQHFASGIVQGRAAIQAYVQRGVDAHYRIDALRVVRMGCADGMMYVITRYDATNAGQKTFGVNLVVLRKNANGWRIVAHEAAVPEPATAIRSLELPSPR